MRTAHIRAEGEQHDLDARERAPVEFYNYGMMRLEALDWIRAAVE